MMHVDIRNSIAGWHFTPQEIAAAVSTGAMLNPSIDLTNACNLNCPYCYVEEKNSVRKVRRPNELTLKETQEIIDDMERCGARTINIVGAGEPTIDPHFVEIIDYIHDKGLWTVLFTNGIVFASDPGLVRWLYRRDVSVVLKLNSFSEQVQDVVAGREGYTRKRNVALQLLLDAGFNAHEPTRLGADIIVFRGNLNEIPRIHDWCRAQNIFPIAAEYIPTGRTEGGLFQGFVALNHLTPDQRTRADRHLQQIASEQRTGLLEKLLELDKQYHIDHPSSFAYFGGGACTQILGLYVDIEGNIWPCVARKRNENGRLQDGLLGNTRRGDLPSRIWKEHPYLARIRNIFDGGCPYKAPLNLSR